MDDIRAAITDIWPDASVTDVNPLPGGKNSVYELSVVDAPAEAVIVKAGTATPRRVTNEAAVINYVSSATSLPVPTVYETVLRDDPVNPRDVPFYLMDVVPGGTFDRGSDELSPETFERVCYEAGQALGELHTSLSFGGVGPLEPSERGLTPAMSVEDWPSMYRRVVRSQVDELQGTQFDDWLPDIRAYADRAVEDLRAGEPVTPVFTHMDYRLENLKLRPGRRPVTAGILDWGGAAAAPAAYELAHTEQILLDWPLADPDRRAAVRNRFYEGYSEAGGSRPQPSRETRYQHYQLSARLRVMKHLDVEMEDASQSAIDDRVREHVQAIRDHLGDS